MIISRTPYRISFFGGGTDYPGWFRQHGGAVLATSIDKYCYLTCRWLPPFFEHRTRVVYSRIENCRDNRDIQHPAVREVVRYLGIERGLEIHCSGDLPARSGIGSSSTFTVGLLHALYELQGQTVDKQRLAREAIFVEQELLRETVGCQDQVMAAYGGLRHVVFSPGGEISARPVPVAAERIQALNDHLLLFFTGINRAASQVAQSYVCRIQQRQRQLAVMGEMVGQALEILQGDGDLDPFGHLMHKAWLLKRSLSSRVSSAQIDHLYTRARQAGAFGGKITGAGGGGFLLLFAPPERHEAIRQALAECVYVPFRFESGGSRIILARTDQDSPHWAPDAVSPARAAA